MGSRLKTCLNSLPELTRHAKHCSYELKTAKKGITMISMFAIPNCDTVKKARSFLEKMKIAYEFIDFKKAPPTKAQIITWSNFAGELPINKKGMTYRNYKDHYEALTMDEKIEFIIANSSLIKRPILMQNGNTIAMGFSEKHYEELIGKS